MCLTRATWILVACSILLGVFTEEAARFGLQHISRIQHRIDDEAAAALTIRHAVDGRTKSVLFIGNSLLLAGVDMKMLEDGLRGRYAPLRYVLESTNYYDWLYGLKQLFRQGMKPDIVVLCLSPNQLTTSAIRGDFSAHFLFGVQDIWPASRASGADLTTTSGYYVAHYSAFYGARSELRNVLIGKFAPSVIAMWQYSVITSAAIPADEQLIPIMEPRLREIAELCARYGTEFQFLIPPTRQSGDTAIVRAGELADVVVSRPIPNKSLYSDFYQADNFHLNEKGETIFTMAVIREMLR